MKDIFRLTVTLVIGLTAVIAKELHRIAFRKIVGMLPDEFFISYVSGWQISRYIILPLTASQRVGMVSMYSNREMVKPYTLF